MIAERWQVVFVWDEQSSESIAKAIRGFWFWTFRIHRVTSCVTVPKIFSTLRYIWDWMHSIIEGFVASPFLMIYIRVTGLGSVCD